MPIAIPMSSTINITKKGFRYISTDHYLAYHRKRPRPGSSKFKVRMKENRLIGTVHKIINQKQEETPEGIGA
jgi:hypothetical protein